MIKYKIQIDDIVQELGYKITASEIQAFCETHGARFAGKKTVQYYQWIRQITEVTYLLRKEEGTPSKLQREGSNDFMSDIL